MARRRCPSSWEGGNPLSDADAPGHDTDGPEVAPEPVVATRHGVPVSQSRGQEVLHPSRDEYPTVAQALFDEGFLVCVDVTAVDYLTYPGDRALPDGVASERFEVVTSFVAHRTRQRVRLRVQVPADDPEVASLTHLYPGVEASEREVLDLFGIGFVGHPDPTRIIMPEDWTGHPLRKDYDSGRIPVQFKGPAPAR
jgi:NADH-quinone oxidoreductase subunit C